MLTGFCLPAQVQFGALTPLPWCVFPPADAAGAQVRGHPEARAGLAGAAALPPHAGSHRVPAVLLPPHDGQEGAQEAQDRGTLRGALQEASHWLGEQDHAAAAENRRAGKSSRLFLHFLFHVLLRKNVSKSWLPFSVLWALTECTEFSLSGLSSLFCLRAVIGEKGRPQ